MVTCDTLRIGCTELKAVPHAGLGFHFLRVHVLEARGGERKLAGLPVVCCWCCCCRCCAGRCCAGCSAGAGSSAAAAAAAGAGWSAAAAAAAALGMLLLLLPLLRWALQMLGALQLLGGPAHRAQGGVEPRGGGSIRLI